MERKKDNFPSILTVDNYSSTATLNKNEPVKISVESDLDKDYNQYEHRELEHPNTFSGAFIHVVKSSLGTGILAMPRAFKTAGLAVGFIGTLLVGLLCTHTVNMLVSASQKMCVRTRTPSLGYAETAESVFQNGPKRFRKFAGFARNFSEMALALTYFMGISVYVVFIAGSLQKLIKFYYEPAGDDLWDLYLKLMILGPLILCCQVKQLKNLVPFSLIANITMILAFAITLYYTFVRIPNVDINDRNMATGFSGLPSFFSTILFAMEGVGTILPVENSMVTPQFLGCPGVLNMGMTVIVSLFASLGLFGYYSFGEETEAVITGNLPNDEVLAQIVQGSISLAVFFTFMLQYYVPNEIIWKKVKARLPEKRHKIGEIITRILLVIIIVGIGAAAGNHLDALIDLVGAVFLSTLGFIIPAVLDIVVNWENWGKFHYLLVKDLVIIVIALFALSSGSYSALREIIG